LVPLGISLHPPRPAAADGGRQTERRHGPVPRLGDLPLARRDVERLRQVITLQRRLHDLSASPKARRALTHRSIFRDALTWLEVHGNSPEVAAHWNALADQRVTESRSGDAVGNVAAVSDIGGGMADIVDGGLDEEPAPFKRKRRRRRRRVRPAPTER
jgi:hypothetical protein